MFLTRLIYHSRPSFDPGDPALEGELDRILAAGLKNNPPQALTGALVLDGDRFIQVLEGARRTVSATFRRIAADPRHHDVELVFCGEIDTRRFDDWSVATLRADTLPACEPVRTQYDLVTADGLLERVWRIRRTGRAAPGETPPGATQTPL